MFDNIRNGWECYNLMHSVKPIYLATLVAFAASALGDNPLHNTFVIK